MSINTITPDKLYLILPYKVSQLAILYARKFNVSIREAIKSIYKSKTYKDLENEETKLWQMGPVGLLEYLIENQ